MATYNGTDGNDTVAGAANEDNTFLGFGKGFDTLTGGNLRDVFRLRFAPDTDVIDGGSGIDQVDYSASIKGLKIDLSGSGGAGTVRFVQTLTTFPDSSPLGPGAPVTYTTIIPVANLTSIEDVIGSKYDDEITGSSGANVLDGGAGADTIRGLAGDDTILGGAQKDKLFGGTGKNAVDGGLGDDTITLELENPTTGASLLIDTIAGGDGIDTLLFAENIAGDYGVAVTLANGSTAGDVSSLRYNADGFMDRSRPEAVVTGIENVTGTGQDDAIRGNGDANVLKGMEGDDFLDGGRGQDTVNGGGGADRIASVGDNVTDLINGGTGVDTVSYGEATRSVRVTLAESGQEGSAVMIYTSTSSTGITTPYSVTEDRLVAIENVTGTRFGDTITGNSQDNELIGMAGQDTLRGRGGKDILDGGEGRDTLTGGGDADIFRFSHTGIGANADRITDFVSGQDQIDFSPFYSEAFAFHLSGADDIPPPAFIGSQQFSNNGNELRMFVNSAGETVIQLNLYEEFDDGVGFGVNDIEIVVVGAVSQNDFLF